MGTIITGYLPAAGLFGRMAQSNPGSAIAAQRDPASRKNLAADARLERLTAYEIAVLLAVGAAILSCL
ncbi:MAG TPA: hypothetical protein VHW70_09500 [Edaphobacter sp.]|nr:hypothetical protein [Edaphobacter sp.]